MKSLKMAASTVALAGVLLSTFAGSANAFFRWGGTTNANVNDGKRNFFYDFVIDDTITGEFDSEGSIYKGAVRNFNVFENIDKQVQVLSFPSLDLKVLNTFDFESTFGIAMEDATLEFSSPEPDTLLQIDIPSESFGKLSVLLPNGTSLSSPGSSLEGFFSVKNWPYECAEGSEITVSAAAAAGRTTCAEGSVGRNFFGFKGGTEALNFEQVSDITAPVKDVPEPSVVLSLLALSALGTRGLLKKNMRLKK